MQVSGVTAVFRRSRQLYAPTRYPDALGDAAPMDVFGPEDAEQAMRAAKALVDWAGTQLNPVA